MSLEKLSRRKRFFDFKSNQCKILDMLKFIEICARAL